jgi:hypothetical protein
MLMGQGRKGGSKLPHSKNPIPTQIRTKKWRRRFMGIVQHCCGLAFKVSGKLPRFPFGW